jgi:predicted kinase
MAQVLFLLSGPPASGKTTLRSKMFPKATIICPDEFIGYTKENPWTPKVARAAWKKADNNVKESLERGDPLVVFDATFVSPKARRKYIKIAKEHDAIAMIIYCTATLDTILTRNAGRANSRKVPGFVMKRMINNFEAPTTEEGFEVVMSFDSEKNEATEIEGILSTSLCMELGIKISLA